VPWSRRSEKPQLGELRLATEGVAKALVAVVAGGARLLVTGREVQAFIALCQFPGGIVPADDAVLDKPLARFGHFLFLFFRLQKLTRIPYRHRPRETVYMFDSIENSFDGHTQRRLVDHTQDKMTLQYLPEGFKAVGA
jgi:hypothetical protein